MALVHHKRWWSSVPGGEGCGRVSDTKTTIGKGRAIRFTLKQAFMRQAGLTQWLVKGVGCNVQRMCGDKWISLSFWRQTRSLEGKTNNVVITAFQARKKQILLLWMKFVHPVYVLYLLVPDPITSPRKLTESLAPSWAWWYTWKRTPSRSKCRVWKHPTCHPLHHPHHEGGRTNVQNRWHQIPQIGRFMLRSTTYWSCIPGIDGRHIM